MTGHDWRSQAECLKHDPDLWFPDGVSGRHLQQEMAAKAVCAGCLVQTECLDMALAERQLTGVWGGTNDDERQRLRRKERRG